MLNILIYGACALVGFLYLRRQYRMFRFNRMAKLVRSKWNALLRPDKIKVAYAFIGYRMGEIYDDMDKTRQEADKHMDRRLDFHFENLDAVEKKCEVYQDMTDAQLNAVLDKYLSDDLYACKFSGEWDTQDFLSRFEYIVSNADKLSQVPVLSPFREKQTA